MTTKRPRSNETKAMMTTLIDKLILRENLTQNEVTVSVSEVQTASGRRTYFYAPRRQGTVLIKVHTDGANAANTHEWDGLSTRHLRKFRKCTHLINRTDLVDAVKSRMKS